MEKQFDLLRITRNNILNLIDGLSMDQLHITPDGFNNNLIWNFGHVIITQQLLCYKLAGKEMKIDTSLVDKYRKGTAPKEKVSEQEFAYLNNLLFPTIDQLADDYGKGIFTEFKEYPTSYNATLNSIEDAINFNNLHEALHLGSMMALKRNI